MAQSNIDTIYKSLRLLPEFDGNPHVLTRFINLCDQLVLGYFKTEPGHELSNLALINGILNKISGSAACLINSNGIPENWQGIRNALVNNFADHRDETALYNDLSLQTQGSSTPQEFYERCQNLFSTIMTYVSLHESVVTTIEAKRELYKKLTLQAYLRGLKDPLGYRIRCMRPESMEKALEFVQDELNTLYLQQRAEGNSNRKDWQQQTLFSSNHNSKLPHNNLLPKLPSFKEQYFNMPGPSRPFPVQGQSNQGWRPNFPPQIQHRGFNRTQQMMRAPPPNYNPQNNGFKLLNKPQQPSPQFKPAYNNNTPRPMSGVSHFVPKPLPPSGHDWRKFGNPPSNNYFKTRDVNFGDFSDPHDYNDFYNYDYNNYSDYDYCNYDQHAEYYTDYDQYYSEEPTVTAAPELSETPNINDENFQTTLKLEKPK